MSDGRCAVQSARTAGKRCGNLAGETAEVGGSTWSVCELHGGMIRDGRPVRIHPEARPIDPTVPAEPAAEPVEDVAPTWDAPDAPAAPVETDDGPAMPRELAEFPEHAGPEAEPVAGAKEAPAVDGDAFAAAARDVLGELPAIPAEGEPAPAPDAPAAAPQLPAPATARGPWNRSSVTELLDASVHPWLRSSGAPVPDRDAVGYFAEKAADCLNIILARVDPNSPWGALCIAAVVVYGRPGMVAVRNRRRGRRPASSNGPAAEPEAGDVDRPETEPEPAEPSGGTLWTAAGESEP